MLKTDKLSIELKNILFSERYFDVAIAMRDATAKRFAPLHVQEAAWDFVEELLQIIDREKLVVVNKYRAKMGLEAKAMETVRYRPSQPGSSNERSRLRFKEAVKNNRYNTNMEIK